VDASLSAVEVMKLLELKEHYEALRSRYAASDFTANWSLAEWLHLEFIRWLVQQGRLSS
jgi:hypothetical protein